MPSTELSIEELDSGMPPHQHIIDDDGGTTLDPQGSVMQSVTVAASRNGSADTNYLLKKVTNMSLRICTEGQMLSPRDGPRVGDQSGHPRSVVNRSSAQSQ